MLTTENIVPRAQQVNDALAAWLEAQATHTIAATEHARLKSIVGGNEAERKTARAKMPADEYDAYTAQFAQAEQDKDLAKALEQRAEKILNVNRELLQHEAATIQLQAAQTLLVAYTQPQAIPQRKATLDPARVYELAPIAGIDNDDDKIPF